MYGQLFYLVGEAFRGWKQHRSVIFPSLVTIFLCSFLLAGSLAISLGVLQLGRYRAQIYRVEAFLPAGDPAPAKIESLQAHLLALREIAEVQYRSPQDAWEEFRAMHGDAMLEGLEGNPLPASFVIELNEKGRTPQDLERVVTQVRSMEYFDEVQSSLEWVRRVEKWRLDLLFWPMLLSFLLLVTLSMIIGNAVRLTLYSRRILVENMKYAGGSSFFIQFPFVLEGFLQGLLGSAAGVIAFALGLWSLTGLLPFLLPLAAGLGVLLPLLVATCAALGAFASLRAVRAFLAGDC